MDPETSETYESACKVASFIFLGLLFLNGSVNTIFEELDYMTLMDAIEGPQLYSFIPAMDFKMPPEANFFFAQIKSAASIEPSGLLNSDESPTIADNVFGTLPVSMPLNDRLATIGYDSMAPIAETETVSFLLAMALFGFFVILTSLLCFC